MSRLLYPLNFFLQTKKSASIRISPNTRRRGNDSLSSYDIFKIVFPFDPPEATYFNALFTLSMLNTSSTDASI